MIDTASQLTLVPQQLAMGLGFDVDLITIGTIQLSTAGGKHIGFTPVPYWLSLYDAAGANVYEWKADVVVVDMALDVILGVQGFWSILS